MNSLPLSLKSLALLIGQAPIRAWRNSRALVALLSFFDGHEHPAHGPADGHRQIAPLGLVLQLGQVPEIHVQELRLTALEGLARGPQLLALRGRGLGRADSVFIYAIVPDATNKHLCFGHEKWHKAIAGKALDAHFLDNASVFFMSAEWLGLVQVMAVREADE